MRKVVVFQNALKRAALLFVMILCFSTVFLGRASAIGTRTFFYDPGSVLSEYDKNDLMIKLQSLSIDGGVGIIILPQDGSRYSEADTVAAAFEVYDELCGYQNGVAYVMDMETRYIEIIANGEFSKIITSYEAATITDNVYSYASSGQYFNGMIKALNQIERKLNHVQIPRKMKWVCNLFFAMIASLILNFFLLKATSKLPAVEDTSALKNAEIDVRYDNVKEEFSNRYVSSYKPGSIEAIVESKGAKAKALQIFLFVINVLWFILKVIGSSGGGSSSGGGRSGGGGGHSSGGGGHSSGGHRF